MSKEIRIRCSLLLLVPFNMANSGTSSSSPCGACKFLRRKCTPDCIFAPYFGCEEGAAQFAAVHKVFGASNVSKLLLHVPVHDRCEAVVSIAYQAQARIRDPVYGCVAHIFALQQQVAILQAQLMQVKAQLAQRTTGPETRGDHQWQADAGARLAALQSCSSLQSMASPDSSFNCIERSSSEPLPLMEGMFFKEDSSRQGQACGKRKAPHGELGELQALALRMMKG